MKASDPTGKSGPKTDLPDIVTVSEPKDEPIITQPTSEDFQKPAIPPPDIVAASQSPPITPAEYGGSGGGGGGSYEWDKQ